MAERNTEELSTAFTVSIDAERRFGVTTGISASDRSTTIHVAINPATVPSDLRRPGHIFPLRARPGGVLQRVGVEDLADDSRGQETGQPGQVDARLGLTDALEDAAGTGAEREDVSGTAQIGGDRGGIHGHMDRLGAIARRDAGGHAEPALGIDAHREGSGKLLGIPLGHLRQPQLVAALPRQGQADQAAPVERHEIDHFGRDQLGGADRSPRSPGPRHRRR